MHIPPNMPKEAILTTVERQLDILLPLAPLGIELSLRARKKRRSVQQNRYLMAVMQNIVQFYQETGFRPDDIPDWAMRTDVLKEFFKHRFGVPHTRKLSTKEFGEFVDKIQHMMLEQSNGEYEVIIPPDLYHESWEVAYAR